MKDIADDNNIHLEPHDLAMLEDVLDAVCELRGYKRPSFHATEAARTLINFFQSGIRNKHQLLAMMVARKFL